MPPISPAVVKRRIDALRACSANPKGLRLGAYPSVMPTLEAAGFVIRRISGRSGRTGSWFLTPAGREELARHGHSPETD